jgi:hypothetical protein
VDDPEVPKQFTDYIDSIDFDDPRNLSTKLADLPSHEAAAIKEKSLTPEDKRNFDNAQFAIRGILAAQNTAKINLHIDANETTSVEASKAGIVGWERMTFEEREKTAKVVNRCAQMIQESKLTIGEGTEPDAIGFSFLLTQTKNLIYTGRDISLGLKTEEKDVLLKAALWKDTTGVYAIKTILLPRARELFQDGVSYEEPKARETPITENEYAEQKRQEFSEKVTLGYKGAELFAQVYEEAVKEEK